MLREPKTYDELLNAKYRWPKKGDRLLRRSDDWSGSVEFFNHPITRHAHQWEGYITAGAGLVELSTFDGYESSRHFWIYPILFNYRHCLELALKWTILRFGEQGIAGIEEDHNLWKLWIRCHSIVERFETTDDEREATKAVEQIIKDFHDLTSPMSRFATAGAKMVQR